MSYRTLPEAICHFDHCAWKVIVILSNCIKNTNQYQHLQSMPPKKTSASTKCCTWRLSDEELFHVAVTSLPEDLKGVSKEGGWSIAHAVIATANILEVNIKSVYLLVNGISDPVVVH